jgi:hypothetical protein
MENTTHLRGVKMKTILDYNPPLLAKSGKQYVIRYNVTEIMTEDGKRWECNEVFANSVDYGSIVSALIHSEYSVDAEIAIINNYIAEAEETEWSAYQAHRTWAKTYTNDTLGVMNEID